MIKTQRLLLAPITDRDRENVLDILLDEEVGKTYMVPEFSCREDAVRIFEAFKKHLTAEFLLSRQVLLRKTLQAFALCKSAE